MENKFLETPGEEKRETLKQAIKLPREGETAEVVSDAKTGEVLLVTIHTPKGDFVTNREQINKISEETGFNVAKLEKDLNEVLGKENASFAEIRKNLANKKIDIPSENAIHFFNKKDFSKDYN